LAALILPGTQSVHDAWPLPDQRPAAHTVHVGVPSAEARPAAQGEQAVLELLPCE